MKTIDELEVYWQKRGYTTMYLTDSQDFTELSNWFYGLKHADCYKSWHALLVVIGEAEYHACYAVRTMYVGSEVVKLEKSTHKRHFKRSVNHDDVTKTINEIFGH